MTTPALRHSGTPALRHSGTPALRHSGTPALRHSGTPALREYEQLILFVKPFCAFFKQCTAIGFFLISYKHTVQILQTISSSIIISYKQPLPPLRCACSAGKGFFYLLVFTESFSAMQKMHVLYRRHAGTVYAKSKYSFLKNKSYMSA